MIDAVILEPQALIVRAGSGVTTFCERPFPLIVARAEPDASRRFIEFFTANIRNPNTRAAYARAVAQFFEWCESQGMGLRDLSPFHVAAYIEQLAKRSPQLRPVMRTASNGTRFGATSQTLPLQAPSGKQHLAAIHVTRRGKTPVLSAEDARMLLDSIPLSRKVRRDGLAVEVADLVGLRDRALIGVMVFSFARVGAVVGMRVEDYYQNGKRCWFRLHEKGGKFHEVPAHHKAEAYLDSYLEAGGTGTEKKTPLFRVAAGKTNALSATGMSRFDTFRMIKRRDGVRGVWRLHRLSCRYGITHVGRDLPQLGGGAGKCENTCPYCRRRGAAGTKPKTPQVFPCSAWRRG